MSRIFDVEKVDISSTETLKVSFVMHDHIYINYKTGEVLDRRYDPVQEPYKSDILSELETIMDYQKRVLDSYAEFKRIKTK